MNEKMKQVILDIAVKNKDIEDVLVNFNSDNKEVIEERRAYLKSQDRGFKTDGTVKQAIASLKKGDPVREYLEEMIFGFVHDTLQSLKMDEERIMEMPFSEFDKLIYREYEEPFEDLEED